MKPLSLAAALATTAAATALASGTAHASFTATLTDGAPASFDVDFRGGGGNLGTSSQTFDDIDVMSTGGDLIQFADDGLGVTGGENDETDDIDGDEGLVLTFTQALLQPTLLIGISDLFGPPDGGSDGEDGEVRVDVNSTSHAASFVASADPLGNGNGEWTLALAGLTVGDTPTITLTAGPNGTGNDFSVMGVSQVPLPAAAWLFLGGLGAAGAYGRYRRRQAPAAHT